MFISYTSRFTYHISISKMNLDLYFTSHCLGFSCRARPVRPAALRNVVGRTASIRYDERISSSPWSRLRWLLFSPRYRRFYFLRCPRRPSRFLQRRCNPTHDYYFNVRYCPDDFVDIGIKSSSNSSTSDRFNLWHYYLFSVSSLYRGVPRTAHSKRGTASEQYAEFKLFHSFIK